MPNSDLHSEDDVKIKFLVPYLERRGYRKNCISFNKSIEVHEGRKRKTIYADAVVYATARKLVPLIVCETKPPTEVLNRAVREQAISYARLLPKIAPLTLVTNGAVQVFETVSKRRVADLPTRKNLRADLVRFVLSASVQDALREEARHELFIIDDVQSFKRILKSCHNSIRNNEGYNPIKAFDEMAKVLFCKMHEERRSPNAANRFRTGVFDDSMARLGINVVRQIWQETKANPRFRNIFAADSELDLGDRTTRKIVSMFESYDLSLTAFDVKGEAFEYFLGETFTGGLGQYFTPRNVVEFMIEAVDPKIGETIVDPFCGTGGFLIYAFELVADKIRLQDFSETEKERWRIELSNRSLFGTDWEERNTGACKMNMIVHGDGSAGIVKHHGLVDVEGLVEQSTFDLCITNPPFGSNESDPEILNDYELGRGRESQERVILAIERALRLVKPNGRVAIIVMDGVLNNDSTRPVREFIRNNAAVDAVISLPSVTFEGYHSRAKTSILFLRKRAEPDCTHQPRDTFMALVKNTGYAANGANIPGNELPDVLLDLRAYMEGTSTHTHSRTWTTALADRLDAEYYQSRYDVTVNFEFIRGLSSDILGDLDASRGDLTKLEERVESVFAAVAKDATEFPLGDLFECVRNPIVLEAHKSYRRLGVRWWGCGTFEKDEEAGNQIKATKLFQVEPGWLIYNKLFAYRGSFAVVHANHGGCYVSNEFPTFRPKSCVENSDFLTRYAVHCMNSPKYLTLVDRGSTGSTKTSRNRFKEDRFLEVRIAVPNDGRRLEEVVELMDRALILRCSQTQVAERVKALHNAVGSMLPTTGA